MQKIKNLVKSLLPPIVMSTLRSARRDNIRFEGGFASWEDAAKCCSGYDANHILAKVLDATLKVQRGEAVFERDSVLFDEIDYAWPVTSGLMWAAARNAGRLNVLDFGGSLGSSYFQNRKFLHALADVKWNVVEQPHYVQAGQAQVQDETLRFYGSIRECLQSNQPNVILLSSVLQYLGRPHEMFDELGRSGAQFLIIDRTPFSALQQDKVAVQVVPPRIYEASYPMWVLGKAGFLEKSRDRWELVASWTNHDTADHVNMNFVFSFQGMIFEAGPRSVRN